MNRALNPVARVVLVISAALMLGACDSWFIGSNGPSAPRLSATLTEEMSGSEVYLLRIVVIDPARGEYLGLTASHGATLSLAGTFDTAFCLTATQERVLEVQSAQGAPTVAIVLGRSPTAGGARSSECASSLTAEESIVVQVPPAPVATFDAGTTGFDAAGSPDGSGGKGTPGDAGPVDVDGSETDGAS